MSEMKKADHIKCWWGCRRIEPSYSAGENEKWYNHFGNQVDSFLKLYTYIYHMTQTFHSSVFIYPKEMKTYVYTNTHTGIFIAALFVIIKNGNSTSWTSDWINKLRYIHTVENCSARKGNKLMIHTSIWLNLRIIILKEARREREHIIWFHL